MYVYIIYIYIYIICMYYIYYIYIYVYIYNQRDSYTKGITLCKLMYWFLYDRDLLHERVK